VNLVVHWTPDIRENILSFFLLSNIDIQAPYDGLRCAGGRLFSTNLASALMDIVFSHTPWPLFLCHARAESLEAVS
jgi:hypothetical protein